MMEKEEELYRKRTRASAGLFSRANRVLPGGVCHTIRYFPPYPFYVKRAGKARVWDQDDNEYIDFWMGHTALILGHTPPTVIQGIREQASIGCQWGMVNDLQIALAELVVESVPCAEMVRFCNTGAEATMYACRLARGFTGRTRVAKMQGGWHGFNTDLLSHIHFPMETPESLGVSGARSDAVALPFNDVEGSLDLIRKNGKNLAAIILEPVLGSMGFLPANPDYLRALREAADETGALLIFDEIITGFRLSLGGGQEYFGVTPDMATLGKILGGGMPVGAIAGSEEVLSLSDSTRASKGESVAIGGGTFSCNPVTMRAGLETLRYLRSHPEIYDRIANLGKRAREAIESNLAAEDRFVACTGIGSLFRTHFALEEVDGLRTAAEVAEKTDKDLLGWMKLAMANRGIFLVEGGGSVSTAHTKDDVERLGAACGDASHD
jgi:glutamate-1-semialdehyde 2,1-aminomutase